MSVTMISALALILPWRMIASLFDLVATASATSRFSAISFASRRSYFAPRLTMASRCSAAAMPPPLSHARLHFSSLRFSTTVELFGRSFRENTGPNFAAAAAQMPISCSDFRRFRLLRRTLIGSR